MKESFRKIHLSEQKLKVMILVIFGVFDGVNLALLGPWGSQNEVPRGPWSFLRFPTPDDTILTGN